MSASLYVFAYVQWNSDMFQYGGDDVKAMKSAAHELRSVIALMGANVAHLHFPLMALLNCQGFVVTVQSVLPVAGQGTLVYGSNDAGCTIVAADQAFDRLMKQALKKLNLRGHRVWDRRRQYYKLLYGPGDMEGHRGEDGRYYLIDCARLFPAAPPPPGYDNTISLLSIAAWLMCCSDGHSHLYRLLRPELVSRNPESLVSDVFSGWCWDPPNVCIVFDIVYEIHIIIFLVLCLIICMQLTNTTQDALYHRHACEAFEKLMKEQIPQCADSFNQFDHRAYALRNVCT